MKTIQKANAPLLAVIGEQRFSQGKRYRRSHYAAELSCADGKLLYHSMTGELLLLKGDEAREELVRRWYLVPEDFDEQKHCDQARSVLRLLRQDTGNITKYHVFTTTDCNARCYYCFERGQRRFSMTEQTALDTAEWILAHSGGEKLKITWFGGEPLYNVKAIDVIAETLRERGAMFGSSMFTNAYLLDRETAQRARSRWGLRQVVVTLDGTEDVYNRTKAYIYREGSAYRRVLENLEGALDAGIHVTINLAFDAHNAEDQFDLADELGRRFGGRKGFIARAGLLKERAGKIYNFDNVQEALQTRRLLNEKLAAYGIRQRKLPGKGLLTNACRADNPGTATILPDGRIGRCEDYGDREEVGSIYEGIDSDKLVPWKELRPPEPRCESCVLYPQCLRLKKCRECSDLCDPLERQRKTEDLYDEIRNRWEDWKAGKPAEEEKR